MRLLKSRDDLNEIQAQALKTDIQKGISSLDKGKGIQITEEFLDAVKARGRQKLGAGKIRQ